MMNVQTFFKGLFMALIAVGVTFFSQSPIQYGLLIVTAIATVLAYTGKNLILVLNSTSESGSFNFVNYISALLIALSTGITEYVGMILVNGVVVWLVLGKVVLAVTFTYIGTTLLGPSKTKTRKLFT